MSRSRRHFWHPRARHENDKERKVRFYHDAAYNEDGPGDKEEGEERNQNVCCLLLPRLHLHGETHSQNQTPMYDQEEMHGREVLLYSRPAVQLTV